MSLYDNYFTRCNGFYKIDITHNATGPLYAEIVGLSESQVEHVSQSDRVEVIHYQSGTRCKAALVKDSNRIYIVFNEKHRDDILALAGEEKFLIMFLESEIDLEAAHEMIAKHAKVQDTHTCSRSEVNDFKMQEANVNETEKVPFLEEMKSSGTTKKVVTPSSHSEDEETMKKPNKKRARKKRKKRKSQQTQETEIDPVTLQRVPVTQPSSASIMKSRIEEQQSETEWPDIQPTSSGATDVPSTIASNGQCKLG